MMNKDELVKLAEDLNPVVGYWDPLQLADADFWDQGNEATIGFLREAEIKHGRIAMFGFVGYIFHANNLRWSGNEIAAAVPKDIGPEAMWDAIPFAAKAQIIGVIGVFEFWRENKYVLQGDGEAHYMRGGTPGYFPSFDNLPHPVPYNLYDPLKLSKNKSPVEKQLGRLKEINNGRLAMIGLMGFLAESKVPGSVPALANKILPYDGQVMAPFTCIGADCAVGGIPF